jgi:FMN phosphatase YigB (HAD superfamily)
LADEYQLFTASGHASDELTIHLQGFGIAGSFRRIYGPDLVNTPKHGPAFYERIFSDTGIDPTAAVVVDNTPRCIAWARAAGARAVFVNREGASLDGEKTIRSLADLQGLLCHL